MPPAHIFLSFLSPRALQVRHRVGPLLDELRAGGLATAEGLSFLEAKHLLLLSYCSHIVFYLLLKAEGRPVRDHPVIARCGCGRAGGGGTDAAVIRPGRRGPADGRGVRAGRGVTARFVWAGAEVWGTSSASGRARGARGGVARARSHHGGLESLARPNQWRAGACACPQQRGPPGNGAAPLRPFALPPPRGFNNSRLQQFTSIYNSRLQQPSIHVTRQPMQRARCTRSTPHAAIRPRCTCSACLAACARSRAAVLRRTHVLSQRAA